VKLLYTQPGIQAEVLKFCLSTPCPLVAPMTARDHDIEFSKSWLCRL